MGYLLAALFGGLLLFNSQATPERAARGMESALRRQYPGRQIDVEVKGKRGLDVVRGKFKSVRLTMTGGSASGASLFPIAAVAKANKAGRIGRVAVQLRDFDLDGLRIESADLNWADVVYDWGALRKTSQMNFVSAGPANARILIPVASLQTLLLQRVKDIQNPKMSLQNGRILVSGTRPAPIFETPLPFTLSARPEVRNQTEIWLSDVQATFAGSPLPPALLSGLTEKFNPVYRFSLSDKWPFSMNITRLNAQNDKLEVLADLTFIPAAATSQTLPRTGPTPAPAAPARVLQPS
ncbi:MAG TPA: DUF2993 domain-containing protein [Abditibacteriaceae bacterium]|nr:DUF2993 domain-containing protein [Abditibacteriaceae bacterium]